MSNVPIISFSGGLVTPLVDARIDSEKYQSACRVLQNFIPRLYGAAERRAGTYYIYGMRSSDATTPVSGVATCLLVPFVYNQTIAYVLEFTQYYIRVFYEDALVDEIASSYLEADLFELQFEQVGDVIWITHEDYQQSKFTRLDATTFNLETVVSDFGPFLNRNDLAVKDGNEMTITGTGLTVTNSSDTTYSASVNSNTAYRAFDQNTKTPWYYYADDSWIQGAWSAGVTIQRIRILSDYVKYIEVWAGDTVGGIAKISANAWTTYCKEYGSGDTEITRSHLSNFAEFVLDNSTGYKIWRIVIKGSYSISGHEQKRIMELQMSEDATAQSDDDAILASSLPTFDTLHVGALFAITQPRVNVSVTFSGAGTGSSDPILVDGIARITVATGWVGTVALQRQPKGEANWETIHQWVSYDGNVYIQQSFDEQEENIYYKICCTAYTSGTVKGDITVNDSTHTGICKVIEYTDAYTVKVLIVKDFVSGEKSLRWAEGCWSDYRGWPASCTFIEDRCVYGGMKNLANGTKIPALWLSASGDYDDFDAGVNGGDSFEVPIKSTGILSWVESTDNLLAGTTEGVYVVRSSRMDLPLTPDPPPIVRQLSAYPCDAIKPVKLQKTLAYLSGRQLRELAYDRDSLQWDVDLTAACEQITLSPIRGMALQTNPDTILWCWHDNGELSAFVYDRENDVMAWSEMPLAPSGGGIDPNIKSCAIIPYYGHGDNIYLAVHRVILGKQVMYGTEEVVYGDEEVYNKSSVIYIERMAQRFE